MKKLKLLLIDDADDAGSKDCVALFAVFDDEAFKVVVVEVVVVVVVVVVDEVDGGGVSERIEYDAADDSRADCDDTSGGGDEGRCMLTSPSMLPTRERRTLALDD